MVAEADRMNKLRFPNKKFRRFINITQLMIFSNNMEYDALGGIVPIQGAFYCTGAKKKSPFNCFREHNTLNQDVAPYNGNYQYGAINPEVEKKILCDFNNQVIHTTTEYQTNLILNGLVSSLDHAVQGDTLTNPYHMSDDGQTLRQFDFEVCNPPFNLNFSETRETLAAMSARFWVGVPNIPNKKKACLKLHEVKRKSCYRPSDRIPNI